MVFTAILMFYNTEWQCNHGMAMNYRGKKFYNIGPRVNVGIQTVVYILKPAVPLTIC